MAWRKRGSSHVKLIRACSVGYSAGVLYVDERLTVKATNNKQRRILSALRTGVSNWWSSIVEMVDELRLLLRSRPTETKCEIRRVKNYFSSRWTKHKNVKHRTQGLRLNQLGGSPSGIRPTRETACRYSDEGARPKSFGNTRENSSWWTRNGGNVVVLDESNPGKD